MNLTGSLDAFGLADVFALLASTGKSGALRVQREPGTPGVVWFQDGRVTGASADCTRLGLVRRLVGSGAVDDVALRAALSRAASAQVGVARALLDAGVVEPELVREAAVDQCVDAVFELLRWQQGEFGFDAKARNADDVGVALEHTWLVQEAESRRAAWDGLRQVVPSADGIVSLPVVLEQDPQVSREEWPLLALVDGRRSVRDLVELSGSGEFAVVTVLAGLVRRGLLVVLPPGSTDHVAGVERRLALLQEAETATRTPAPAAAPAPAPAPERGGSVPAAAALAAARAAQEAGRATSPRRAVVPPRPEPFLPGRPVEHPEGGEAYATADPTLTPTAGSAAMVAAPAGHTVVERDPAVNRSLLLRLIAGVRGL